MDAITVSTKQHLKQLVEDGAVDMEAALRSANSATLQAMLGGK